MRQLASLVCENQFLFFPVFIFTCNVLLEGEPIIQPVIKAKVEDSRMMEI